MVMEIGAGWGGFAYAFKTLFQNTTYVIIDLPQTLLFSAVYLRAAFPSASILLYGDKPPDVLLEGAQSYDFIFLPHYFLDSIHKLGQLDLAINIASFQEMTSQQVDRYASRLSQSGCTSIFSHNRDHSHYNPQLTTVSSILENYYQLARIDGLVDVYQNYYQLVRITGLFDVDQKDSVSSKTLLDRFGGLARRGKKIIRNLGRSRPEKKEVKVTDYRYLVGSLNSQLSSVK